MTGKPFDPTRRRFLKSSLGVAGAVAASAVVVPRLRVVDYADPAYAYWAQREKGGLTDAEYIIMSGTLAANPHNTQPWKFRIGTNDITVFADRSRHLGNADIERRMMLMGIGCALENMHVAAARLGYRAAVSDIDADGRFLGDGYCATFKLGAKREPEHLPSFDAMFLRQTTRSAFRPAPALTAALPGRLDAAGGLPGIRLDWFDAPADRERIAAVASSSVREYLARHSRHRDGMRWFRTSRDEWESKRDGISIFTSDAPWAVREWIEWLATPQDLLGDAFVQGEIASVDSVAPATPLWCLISSQAQSANTSVIAGRMLERIYLEASATGLAVQPVCYPTETTGGIQALKAVAGSGDVPQMLVRIGAAPLLERSVRRDLGDVLIG